MPGRLASGARCARPRRMPQLHPAGRRPGSLASGVPGWLLLLLGLLAGPAHGAEPPACQDQLWRGEAPRLVNPKLEPETRALCFAGFALLHSGVSRTPLWSAEHLTTARVRAADAMERKNAFHAEPKLPKSERAELRNYTRSGYDRGHMAPSGDMADARSQHASFSLANIIPQDPDSNEGLWAGIEAAVRDLAARDGELYVVTGPVFAGADLQRLHGRVLVPGSVYKAVYDPHSGQAGAYLVPNAPGEVWQAVSLARLAGLAGIDAFPGLPAAVREHAMALPAPHEVAHGHGQRAHRTSGRAAGSGVLRALKKLMP